MEGLGTELGLLNLVLYALALAVVGVVTTKIRVLFQIDLQKMVKRHNLMWAHYVKEKLEDSGDIADLMD